MELIISGYTDMGTTRGSNQDSVIIKTVNSPQGKLGFAVLCDGMGGLSSGEIASDAVSHAFEDWVNTRLPLIWNEPLTRDVIHSEWNQVVFDLNARIISYGEKKGIKLGTTLVVILVTETNYFVMNVGDSRMYEITDKAVQITTDHTFVAREVAMGRMTPEEAESDSRRNVLLQCIGAVGDVYPEMIERDTPGKAVFLLCSDGFYHYANQNILSEYFRPDVLQTSEMMTEMSINTVEFVKNQGEQDNITVAMIRVDRGLTFDFRVDTSSATTMLS